MSNKAEICEEILQNEKRSMFLLGTEEIPSRGEHAQTHAAQNLDKAYSPETRHHFRGQHALGVAYRATPSILLSMVTEQIETPMRSTLIVGESRSSVIFWPRTLQSTTLPRLYALFRCSLSFDRFGGYFYGRDTSQDHGVTSQRPPPQLLAVVSPNRHVCEVLAGYRLANRGELRLYPEDGRGDHYCRSRQTWQAWPISAKLTYHGGCCQQRGRPVFYGRRGF